MTEPPFVNGVTAAIIGVSDLQPHLELYCGQLGFDVAAEGVIGVQTAIGLWGAGLTELPVTVLAAAGAEGGRIALVGVDARRAGKPEHPYTADVGLAGIDVYTRDIQATHRDLVAAGHPWLTAPARYDVPLGERSVTVTEGFCLAPDGTDLVFVEPANPRGTTAWECDPNRRYTELTSVVCNVPDVDREVVFWGPGGLGLAVWYDVTFSSAGLERMTGLPPGSRLRLAFLAGVTTARIEVTSLLDPVGGVDRRPHQRPGHSLGHSGWVARCRNLEAAMERAAAHGAQQMAGPVPTADPLLGNGRAGSMVTPNGIPVTLFEPDR